MHKHRAFLRTLSTISAAALAGVACSAGSPGAFTEADDESTGALQAIDYASLCCGTRETVVEGIAAAENVMFSSSGRLFVTGDSGLYELVRRGASRVEATLRAARTDCKFGGMAEISGVLYANCYTQQADSFLLAGDITTPDPTFASVYTLSGAALANGLAADTKGHLYVASSLQQKIIRLTVDGSDPFKIVASGDWATGNLLPNGLKYFDGALYWTDFFTIKRAKLKADGTASTADVLASRLTFFDDLYVDQNGILVADYLTSGLDAYGALGFPRGETPRGFVTNPSAVVPAYGRLGFGKSDVVVTEKGANRVSVVH